MKEHASCRAFLKLPWRGYIYIYRDQSEEEEKFLRLVIFSNVKNIACEAIHRDWPWKKEVLNPQTIGPGWPPGGGTQ